MAVAFEAQLLRQTLAEEGREVEGVDVVDAQVVLVLYIYVVGEVAVEVESRGGGLCGQGGVVEGHYLYVVLPKQLAV